MFCNSTQEFLFDIYVILVNFCAFSSRFKVQFHFQDSKTHGPSFSGLVSIGDWATADVLKLGELAAVQHSTS